MEDCHGLPGWYSMVDSQMIVHVILVAEDPHVVNLLGLLRLWIDKPAEAIPFGRRCTSPVLR